MTTQKPDATASGASFDVASLPEFMLVYENIQHLPAKERRDFIWDKITYDNLNELRKIKQYAPHAGLALRLRVPDTGSTVELSSKFGCAPVRSRGPDRPQHLGSRDRGSPSPRPRDQDPGHGLDTISQCEELPDLEIEDLVYSENIGAYSSASATFFNGFSPPR